jgi:hypothetical protein
MPNSVVLAPTSDPRCFRAADGALVCAPPGWDCLPPGDAGLTRRVKAAGPSWWVIEKRGRKRFSRGLWAPRANIEAARAAIEAERANPSYAKRQATAARRRERAQDEYVVEFEQAVLAFLGFSTRWQPLGRRLAALVAAHATPVGSGTVARTARIPISERAESAVIAWMRHRTTAYDRMKIARIKGERREVRRGLAMVSRAVLDLHRTEAPHAVGACPLCAAARDSGPDSCSTPGLQPIETRPFGE